MKKKILILLLFIFGITTLSACGKNKINLADYVIEERESLYTAHDDIYSVSLSSGLRENNYALDGIVNEMVDFSILTLNRNDNQPLANDTYTYIVKINEDTHTGFLTKSEINNTYSTDLEISIPKDSVINVKISFTGYTFDKDLENTSNSFNVDKNSALNIANEQLKNDIDNLLSNKNTKIEVVIKLLKDSTNEINNYYWYVGIVSTNGETLGILIDANTGDIIAKKV